MCEIQRSTGSREPPAPSYGDALITVRSSVPTTPYPHLPQGADQRPPHPHQFLVSCPMYLCVYEPTYIRCIVFACHFYIPEHYRCFLRRALRDVDLHRPATRRRRHVELPNPTVHIPSVTHQCRSPNTYRTNTYLQSHTAKPPLQRLLI